MEDDDDEFGDLYTDVLRPLTSSSSAPQPDGIQSTPPSANRPFDLNIHSDDEHTLSGAPNSKPSFSFTISNQIQNLVFEPIKEAPVSILTRISDSHWNSNSGDELVNKEADKEEDIARIGKHWALNSSVSTESRVLENTNVDIVVDETTDEGDILVANDVSLIGKSENFQNVGKEEVDNGIGDLGSEQIIPGLLITGISGAGDHQGDAHFVSRDEASGEGDDWDSDSEDDLQIVLNDNHHGPMTMDRDGVDDDEEDEDGDPLVIVADSDQNHPPMDAQEWGEDAAQGADGERKELGDVAQVNGGVMIPPKTGYSNHGYHPFHSQFKYVRPGAAPMLGAAPTDPAGVPSQVRPPIGMAPISGRGRGDWRPPGMKSFYPGFGTPVWGNNTSGRAFGLEFTLPSYKTIFDVEVDSFEEKPWRLPGIDLSDFFNFGLSEESWKGYCKQLGQLRLEGTMQSKIRVYEGGRIEQEHDPDLPPELAAAAGIYDILSENASLGKADAGQGDLANVSSRVRPPLPIGRPIQVECGYGERLPSIDTRPLRIRDSDAIIEIVLQDSADDDSFRENDVAEQSGLKEDLIEGQEIEEVTAENDSAHFDSFPHAYNYSERDGTLPSSPEAPHEKRQTKARTRDTSPNTTPTEGTQDKRFLDNQKEESVESIDGKYSPPLTSPVSAETAGEHDELVLADGSSEMEREQTALLNKTTDSLKDENLMHSLKRQKLSSRVEQPSLQEIDYDDDLKAARSTENGKARSGSNRDYQKSHDGVEQEVLQDRRSTRMGNIKRPLGEDNMSVYRKGHDERPVIKRYRRDDDPHSMRNRAEDSRKLEHGDEVGSRHRVKVRESERSDKNEHLQLRKQLDNGDWMGPHDKDTGLGHGERNENLKSRYENMDDQRSKRRKEEERLRRDHFVKVENLHGLREITTHRKRERDEEENWFQRERGERRRPKQSHQESLSKRERDEERGGTRSGRAVEDKVWVGYGTVKDDYKVSDRHYQIKRKEQIEDESLSPHRGREDVHARGTQLSNEERSSRQERAGTRNDHAVNASDSHRATEKKRKENRRKSKESECGHNSSLRLSKKNQEDLAERINETVILKGASEHEALVNHHSSRKHRENASSDDEQQDSRRGRSKLERWTSHKEKDFSFSSKSSSLKIKEVKRYNNGRSSLPTKKAESNHNQQLLGDEKDSGELDIKNVDAKPAEERHLDTVAKLRKRSERFKLLMPSEKEAVAIKKIESEPLPSAKSEIFADSDIEHERPPRKRRWISS